MQEQDVDIERFCSDDDEDGDQPRAFTSDEERERMAAIAEQDAIAEVADVEAAEEDDDPEEPIDNLVAGAKAPAVQVTLADVAAASVEIEESKRPKKRDRKATIAGVVRVLSDGETVNRSLVDCRISDERRIEMVQEMVILLDSKKSKETEWKEQAKIVKGEISDLELRARDLGRAASQGIEGRMLEVATLRDDRVGDMTLVRCDTGEEIKRWPQTFMERQAALPGLEVAVPSPTDIDAAEMKLTDAPPTVIRRRGRPKKAVNGAVAATVAR